MHKPAEVPDISPVEHPAGSVTGRLAHDFNNLLTGILGHLSMIQNEPTLSSDARKGLEQIRRAADRATELTRRLHTLGRSRPSVPRVSDPAIPRPFDDSIVGTETILLVEDDDDVRELARRALERHGYTVLAVRDAEAATALADRHPGYIHLLLADVVLPHLSGRELAARLGIHRPAIKVLYISGTNDDSIIRHRMLEPSIAFLEKPFSLHQLLGAVRRVLGNLEPAREAAQPM